MNTLPQRIHLSIAKNPHLPNWRIAKNLNCRVADVRAVRGETPQANGPTPFAHLSVEGVCLRGAKVLSRRPVDSAAKFIKRLPVGRGFGLNELAKEWGMSEETIRRHAKDLGCIKYVEVSEDEWVPLVMNPETAKQYTV